MKTGETVIVPPAAGRWAALVLTLAAMAPTVTAADPAPDAAPLAEREADLLRQYRELERSFLRLADLLATSDPRRAAVLRDAFRKAREADVGERIGRIVELLEQGQLLAAGTSQEDAIEQFRGLLDLLEEGGRDRNLADTKKEVRRFLARVAGLIARQREIEAGTEAGGKEQPLAARQRQAADETADLAVELESFARRIDDSEPDAATERAQPAPEDDAPEPAAGDPPRTIEESASPPPQEEPPGDDDVSRARRTRQRLQAAEGRMRDAEKRLSEAERQGARGDQQKAIEELETARAELEEILRQMREEEVERLIVQLETRVRTMLKAEREILAATGRLAAAEAMSRRERQLEAARIGREQEQVTIEADRALALVRDDGSAVAIPEALGQVRDDASQVATRLKRGDLTPATLGIVGDVVTGLEELLAALEKSRRDEERRQEQAGAGGGRPAEPDEQPLVDRLAELKMLRSLQARVNARTERLAELLDEGAERSGETEIVAALGRLADRQRAIERAARDIVTGRTEP